ncbi:hypothetical protein predicted by Glimmer/Critica [Lactiplantibacillus plantarum]|nr:hypothetical protein predicted by Glimmer/Critica [Lactiplantibacillus plantarum]
MRAAVTRALVAWFEERTFGFLFTQIAIIDL